MEARLTFHSIVLFKPAVHYHAVANTPSDEFPESGSCRGRIRRPMGLTSTKYRHTSHAHAAPPLRQMDCTAHSVEYDVVKNIVRPLTVLTDVWCSSGSVMPNGTFYHTGGNGGGGNVVRVLNPCSSGGLCDWNERPNALLAARWYASNHVLPDKRQIIIGGRGQFNYEFYPKNSLTNKLFALPFLSQTNDPGAENNLYPLVIQNVDGNLFFFANNRAILFNYKTGSVLKTYPTLPDRNPRSYPSTGSGALNTCGRMIITDPNPQWVMETMPLARVMGDMQLLPDGNVVIINRATRGTAGWELRQDPIENVSFHCDSIRDGRVLVVVVARMEGLSLEPFSPSYLDPDFDFLQPRIVSPKSQSGIKYGRSFNIRFTVNGTVNTNLVKITMVSPSFTTHSMSMNHRLLELSITQSARFIGKSTYNITVSPPSTTNLALLGYYMLFVVHQDIPSGGIWVRLQ
ncbi:OLC1v1038581C1 [Oldenlandia corymbosa var. corymbosa]|uniref:OLC1v1038581C1 n=1 Tax=Oldenlandia corymbosa var. corymbosa TaxID=529605 RepID=A0AAV1D2U3_OLDCO|nr:OLC1v1038581C1 [Oldenlandia corymbosa var. corymbosa]